MLSDSNFAGLHWLRTHLLYLGGCLFTANERRSRHRAGRPAVERSRCWWFTAPIGDDRGAQWRVVAGWKEPCVFEGQRFVYRKERWRRTSSADQDRRNRQRSSLVTGRNDLAFHAERSADQRPQPVASFC